MIFKNKIIGCEIVRSMNLSNTFQVLQKTKSLDLNGRVIDTNNYQLPQTDLKETLGNFLKESNGFLKVTS